MTEAVPRRVLRRRRRRPTAVGVLGEILVTIGVVVLLYVAWQLWIGDLIIGAQRSAVGSGLSASWAAAASGTPSATASETPATALPTAPAEPATAPPIVLPQPGDGEVFGVMHVPRWGAGFAFPVAGGVTRAGTLDQGNIGHYPDTAMPGEAGNFAVAGHRGSNGAPFENLPALHIGDAVVVETADGWYTYRFRNIEYVDPTATDVLTAVPQISTDANGTYLTMTTCSPRYGSAERLIAYGVFESFTPRTSGAPTSLAAAG